QPAGRCYSSTRSGTGKNVAVHPRALSPLTSCHSVRLLQPMRATRALIVLVLAPAALLAGPADFHRVVLDNGLTVLVQEDHRSPLVSVGIMYAAGARNEAAGQTGIAHYVEHMNFRASARFPGSENTESITRLGGRWNGYTWIDQTYYASTVPL